MKRLPGIENGSPGTETAGFGSLALASLAAIALVISASVNFANDRDRVVVVLGGRAAVIWPAAVDLDAVTLTNVNHLESRTAVAVDPNKV